jgi:hypothetical protein
MLKKSMRLKRKKYLTQRWIKIALKLSKGQSPSLHPMNKDMFYSMWSSWLTDSFPGKYVKFRRFPMLNSLNTDGIGFCTITEEG